MTFLVQRFFTPPLSAFIQNWFKWEQAVFCTLTSVHAHLKTAYCYCQQCCMCACWIPPAQTPTSPPAFLTFSIHRCVHVCISAPMCSVQAPSTLICSSKPVALLDVQAQCCSLSQAFLLYTRLNKLARNSGFTLRIVQASSKKQANEG